MEFYETEEFLASTLCGFMAPGLYDGDAVVIVATAAHRRMFDSRLRAEGVDLGQAVARGDYLAFDAADVLGRFMVDGAPDPAGFRRVIGEVLDTAAGGGRRVRVYGEMVALLWADGHAAAALALEDLWNDLATTHEFALLCAYPHNFFAHGDSLAGFHGVCDRHTSVIPRDGYPLLN